MVICLKRGADLHMAQLMPLLPTVSCSSKIQIGFTFLVPAHPGSPGKRAVKRVCVNVCVWGSLVTWVKGHTGHRSHWSLVSSLIGQTGDGSRGSRVSSLMGQMGRRSQNVTN